MSPIRLALCIAAVIPLVGSAQESMWTRDIGSPLMGPFVRGVPFEADAITTAHLTLGDGTRLNQKTTAHYYRDSAGHARVELLMEGLPAPHTDAERHMRTILNTTNTEFPKDKYSERGPTFALDDVTRTAHYDSRGIEGLFTGGPGGVGVPVGGIDYVILERARDVIEWDADHGIVLNGDVTDEALGNREIEGVDTVGRRVTLTIPPGSRDDKPAVLVDERWESAELKLLIAGHASDSRWGEVDYRVTNVRRVEPPADLFVVPSDYTLEFNSHDREPWLSLGGPGSYSPKRPFRQPQ